MNFALRFIFARKFIRKAKYTLVNIHIIFVYTEHYFAHSHNIPSLMFLACAHFIHFYTRIYFSLNLLLFFFFFCLCHEGVCKILPKRYFQKEFI